MGIFDQVSPKISNYFFGGLKKYMQILAVGFKTKSTRCIIAVLILAIKLIATYYG
ncbi:hypothetical protein GCM10007422_12830 [Pedobacter zeae]|uniref:Uncharacterized protein n=1 Tax=Pedobacter zeae TaxID=1737356 RepID=A0ABQ1XQ63_9SPHI|nr:hypothetical protein GCM10007422_12830 [Pedobacter zeae]